MSKSSSKSKSKSKILITGGAGFIGSALVRYLVGLGHYEVINIDKLTYAGHLASLRSVENAANYTFEKHDICDAAQMQRIFKTYQPDVVMHLAAESHVDRSISASTAFMQTNILGTHTLLEVARVYYETLNDTKKRNFRFLHVSTDEVFGSLGEEGFFTEKTPYDPRSPYSSSKAASDHLARAWFHTYGLPVLVSNCSNNYGPYQYPEKLIPVVILKALSGQAIPVYGKGVNVRDWLFVDDHVKALLKIVEEGIPGNTYNIGGHNEKNNLEVVQSICEILNELKPSSSGKAYQEQITFVTDRLGHDFRYAIDATKISEELGWNPEESFLTGIQKTVQWYLANDSWIQEVKKERS